MTYKYSAAISFLSRDKDVALQLRNLLDRVLPLPVFVYCDAQNDLTGKTFEDALCPVFQSLARIVVVLFRPEWGKRQNNGQDRARPLGSAGPWWRPC